MYAGVRLWSRRSGKQLYFNGAHYGSRLNIAAPVRHNGTRLSSTSADITPNRHTPVDIEDWALNDEYHNNFLIPKDDILSRVLQCCEDHGLPRLAVSEAQGKWLNLLVRTHRAQRILEVGTLGGYSTIWLARALPSSGEIVTLEISEKYSQVARKNFEIADLKCRVRLITGPAHQNLSKLEPDPPFDIVFIDADKVHNVAYFKEAKRLVKKGGVIIVDNVVWHGRVPLPEYDNDPDVLGIRELLQHVSTDSEVDATTLATVGPKGYDGLMYAIRL